MKRPRYPGQTNVLVTIAVQNAASTFGGNLMDQSVTGSGITASYYIDSLTTPVSISLTDAGTLGTWNSGSFKQVATSGPFQGTYQISVPNDTRQGDGSMYIIYTSTVSNFAPVKVEIFTAGTVNAYEGVNVVTNGDKTGYTISGGTLTDGRILIVAGTNGGGTVSIGGNVIIIPPNNASLNITSGGAVLGQPATAGSLTIVATVTTLTTDPTGVTTLLGRLTSTRAGYLDNLNVGGLVASAANLLNLTNNTFVASDVPQNLERPDAGSETVPITFIFCDDTGAAKDLDSGNPTLALTNNAGTDLSARLAGGGATWTHVATGEYKILYTNTSTDAIATLHWKVTGTINSVVRKAIFPTQLVDVTAVDFTSSDRTDLQTILARADVATSTRLATSGYTVPPTVAAIRIEMDSNSTQLAAAVSAASSASTNANTAANSANSAALVAAAVGSLLTGLLGTDQTQYTAHALALAPGNDTTSAATIAKLATTLEAGTGTKSRFTSLALVNAPSGGGGGTGSTTLIVSPLQTSIQYPMFVTNGATIINLYIAQHSSSAIVFTVADGAGSPVDLSGHELRFVVHDNTGTVISELTSTDGGITISTNQATVLITGEETPAVASLQYKLWDITLEAVLASGRYEVRLAPQGS